MNESILNVPEVEIGIVNTGSGYQGVAWRYTDQGTERITTTQVCPTEQQALGQLFRGIRERFGSTADVVVLSHGDRLTAGRLQACHA